MWDYAKSHNLDFFEGNVIKYVTRWRHKNGIEDLLKAKQYLDKLIEHDLHTDYDYSNNGAVFSINTCDGYTKFEDGTKIKPIKIKKE